MGVGELGYARKAQTSAPSDQGERTLDRNYFFFFGAAFFAFAGGVAAFLVGIEVDSPLVQSTPAPL